MKLINSRVDIVNPTGYTLQDIYKQIELAGRTCYKSEDKLTDNSAKEFVDRMIASKHYAMLEHGTIYLILLIEDATGISTNEHNVAQKYKYNKFSKCNWSDTRAYITTNLRVLVENNWLDDLQYLCEPTEYHEKRITAKFICDRGISHELVRHRVFSFAQESTRYCNYSKDKFGNELTFIQPSDWAGYSELMEADNFDDFTDADTLDYILEFAENAYFALLKRGLKPQQVRAVLPNSLKTEVVMTGFESDWDHFFELRCSKAAHPDMQKLANELKLLFDETK